MVGVYSLRQWLAAVVLAGLWGWASIGLIAPIGYMLTDRLEQGLRTLMLSALVGLPIAFFVSLLTVGPALRKMMERPIGFLRAAIWGAVTSAAIATLSIIWGRYKGWWISLVDDIRFRPRGGGDNIRSIDGTLTPYGWQVLAQDTLFFIAWCVIGAMFIRLVIGPGRAKKS
ncbi:MAG: hypothetical protein AAF922_01620 [Pseudomonadota bacterium]